MQSAGARKTQRARNVRYIVKSTASKPFCAWYTVPAANPMGAPGSASVPFSPEKAAQIRAYLERLLASAPFAASPRRGRLLQYVVELTLEGRAAEISEYAIGVDVFGKPASFDTQSESTVRAEMSRLRRTLAEYYARAGAADPWQVRFPNGYIPVLTENAPVPSPQPQAAQQVEPAPRAAAIARPLAAAILVVVVAAVLTASFIHRPRIESVAVLPFQNLTGTPTAAYLVDGITEQLTDSLARAASLHVVARTSASQFKGKALDIREIGRRLNADAIVEGSVRSIRDGFQVDVQVDRADDGYQIVARTFVARTADLPVLGARIAAPVRAALHPGEKSAPAAHVPDPQAYDLLLKSRAYRGQGTEIAFERAAALLNEAIQIDPGYADAYAALAGVYAAGGINLAAEPLPYLEQAKAAAARALELDPASAHALAAQGLADVQLLHWAQGERELRQAIAVMPEAATHSWLGVLLMEEGRFDDALAEAHSTERLDPLSPAAGVFIGWCEIMARRYDAALAQFLTVQKLHPEAAIVHLYSGTAWELKGDYKNAEAEFQAAGPESPATALPMAHLFAVEGRKPEARAILVRLEHPQPQVGPPVAFDMALVYAALGDRDRAFEWLDRAYASRRIGMLKVHPGLDPIRSDPRYAALLRKTGLAP